MTVCYDMGKTCIVCGARISDNNMDGIGCECRYSYNKARGIVFFDDKERALSYYGLEADAYMPLFIETFKDTKFRSPFKKEFFPSVVKQYEEKGFLSKKQLEICIGWLGYKVSSFEMMEIYDRVKALKKAMVRDYKYNREEIEKICNLANKFRHEYRAMKKK